MTSTAAGLAHLLENILSIGPVLVLFLPHLDAGLLQCLAQKRHLLHYPLVLLVLDGDDDREVQGDEEHEYKGHYEKERWRIGYAEYGSEIVEQLLFDGERGYDDGSGEPQHRVLLLEKPAADKVYHQRKERDGADYGENPEIKHF